jgi:hypothetical protein
MRARAQSSRLTRATNDVAADSVAPRHSRRDRRHAPSLGSRLDPAFEQQLATSLGHSFADLRVVEASEGAAVADTLGADAVAIGGDVFLSAHAPPLETLGGRLLVAHEAAHVAQFDRYAHAGDERYGPASDAAEAEADGAALGFLNGTQSTISADPAGAYAMAERGWLDRLITGVSQEGIGGIFDYGGMMDRQNAQDELRSRFDVRSAEDMPLFSLAGNVVSDDQYQDIARQWSDIRLGRSDIKIDTSGMTDAEATTFQGDTMSDLADMMQTRSGRGMLGALGNQKDDHSTTITRRTDNQNASADAADPSKRGLWSNGTGTDATVNYMPGDAGGMRPTGMAETWLPVRSDVTLMHEMAHAYHIAHGSMSTGTVSSTEAVHADDVGIQNFEYQAAGLGSHASDPYTEQMYRLERMLIGMGNTGERNTGGVTDDAMPFRTSYVWHPAPAAAPGTPAPTGAPGGTPFPFRHEHDHAHAH